MIRHPHLRGLLAILALSVPMVVLAHGGHHKNIKVLPVHEEEALDDGMKKLAKGLGVQCRSCHIKGNYASDALPQKVAARQFLSATLKETDQVKRAAALKDLLAALKLKATKDEAKIWEALALWRQGGG